MKIYNNATVLRAARAKTRGRGYPRSIAIAEIDVPDEYTNEDIEPNCDKMLGNGVWVKAYLFLADIEIESAEDNTP